MPTFYRESLEDWLTEAGSREGFSMEEALRPIGPSNTRGPLAPLAGYEKGFAPETMGLSKHQEPTTEKE